MCCHWCSTFVQIKFRLKWKQHSCYCLFLLAFSKYQMCSSSFSPSWRHFIYLFRFLSHFYCWFKKFCQFRFVSTFFFCSSVVVDLQRLEAKKLNNHLKYFYNRYIFKTDIGSIKDINSFLQQTSTYIFYFINLSFDAQHRVYFCKVFFCLSRQHIATQINVSGVCLYFYL